MNRNTTFASLAILATLAASPVAAQAPVGGAPASYLSADAGNVVGGGTATLRGGGDELIILYSGGGAGGGAGMGQPGRQAGFGPSSGDGLQVDYLGQASAGRGREAWLTGGGEDAAVVYASPTRR